MAPTPTTPTTQSPPLPKRRSGGIQRDFQYTCSTCKRNRPRADLLAKKVEFREMGRGGGIKQSRVVAWVCSECLATDPDWNTPPSVHAPTTAPDVRSADSAAEQATS